MNTLKRRFYFRNVSQIKNSEDKTLGFQHFKEKAEKEEKNGGCWHACCYL